MATLQEPLSNPSLRSPTTMTTNNTSNGRVDIRGMATLKNRRALPGESGSHIYDALFSCADLADGNEDGIGSFRHYVGEDDKPKRNGTYQIHAKVRFAYSVLDTTRSRN